MLPGYPYRPVFLLFTEDYVMAKRNIEERFWEKVAVLSDTQCWVWKAGRSQAGYGVFCVSGKTEYAHRLSWMIKHKKDVPTGMCICHTCDNRKCVNPNHLFLGTRSDNNRDMREKGRSFLPPIFLGENHPKAKLTEQDVLLIRQMRKEQKTYAYIAQRFGVTLQQIYHVIKRIHWKGVA